MVVDPQRERHREAVRHSIPGGGCVVTAGDETGDRCGVEIHWRALVVERDAARRGWRACLVADPKLEPRFRVLARATPLPWMLLHVLGTVGAIAWIRPIELLPPLGEPERAVRPGGDPEHEADAGVGVTAERAARRDPPDRLGRAVREPESAVGSSRYRVRDADARGGVAADRTASRDSPNRVVPVVGEPERAVSPGRDPAWTADAGVGVAADRAASRDPPNRIASAVGEPEGTVDARPRSTPVC